MTEYTTKTYEALVALRDRIINWRTANEEKGTYQVTSHGDTKADEIARKLYRDIKNLFNKAEQDIKEAIENL